MASKQKHKRRKQYYDYIRYLFKKNGQEIRPDVEAIKEYNEFHKEEITMASKQKHKRRSRVTNNRKEYAISWFFRRTEALTAKAK